MISQLKGVNKNKIARFADKAENEIQDSVCQFGSLVNYIPVYDEFEKQRFKCKCDLYFI